MEVMQVLRYLVLVVLGVIFFSHAGEAKKKDRVTRDFYIADTNGDERLSEDEWMRRGNFKKLDQDGDGFISLGEVRKIYEGHDDKNYVWPPKNMKILNGENDPSVVADRISSSDISEEVQCGLGRIKHCGSDAQVERGLLATGTGPVFPDGVNCPGIDDYWAMDYSHKRERTAFHGGIDIPAPWGTPMRAVAAGSVVALYQGAQSKRGFEVVLRHSPDQTGLPYWIYSAYGHLDALPDFKVGQVLAMGDVVGPTGNSGVSGKGGGHSLMRRPAIHLAMFFATSSKYGEVNETIIPQDGYWLDPVAFYRQKEPLFSIKVKALPEDEKNVLVPVLLDDGTTLPPQTKVIWPYTCRR